MICLAVLVGMHFSAFASAEILVGVKKGDWIEYKVTFTGNVPAEHDVTSAKIEIISVELKRKKSMLKSRQYILMEERKLQLQP